MSADLGFGELDEFNIDTGTLSANLTRITKESIKATYTCVPSPSQIGIQSIFPGLGRMMEVLPLLRTVLYMLILLTR